MKIKAFRIRKYRNIEDSGLVELQDNLTCVIGKNQSGKTALLKALYKFNPSDWDPYDLRREWPRGQRSLQDRKQVVCEVLFEMEEKEKSRLQELTGDPITTSTVTIAKDYGGTFYVKFPDQPDLFPETLHAAQVGGIEGQLENIRDARQKAHNYLISELPTFVYMDDYKSFRGRANLEAVREKVDNQSSVPLTGEDETFLTILKLAGLDIDELIKQGKTTDPNVLHDRQLDLQDAATTLTKNVSGSWGQNTYRIQFRMDGQTFFTDIEETDKTIGMIPLEEQSKGFQWFLSFDLRFMHDSGGTLEGCVLLLDEPGLHLHPGGQEDLLKRLDAYSAKNTTIYSTHLPFLVDLREPERIKVMNHANGAAVVSDDLGASQKEEKLTLQAALGIRANQNYRVAQRNLVVEGIDDYWILTELSNVFERSGKEAIPDDVLVTAAGSAPDVVLTSTFMVGQNLKVVALFDSDDAGRREEAKLSTKWLTRYKENKSTSLLLGDIAKAPGDFALEDLFPEDYYFNKLRESHGPKLHAIGKNEADLKLPAGNGTLALRAEQACSAIGLQFDKASVSKLIRKDLKTAIDKLLPKGTAEKAFNVISSIRRAFNEPVELAAKAARK